MRVLFEGEPWVHYGQIYVESSGEFDYDLHDSFAGQANGLCGAASPGSLFLITGLHTGEIGLRAELYEEEPPIDGAWEEIVEVSFHPSAEEVWLVQWAGEDSWRLDVAQTGYRVRYCATGMDQAHQHDTRMGDEPLQDRYLLQFWPSPQQRTGC